MKRKLVKQGRNALTVTVPAAWARKFDLKAGNEVDVEEEERSVIISSGKPVKIRKRTIDISNLNPYLSWNLFNIAYRKGYEEIELIFDKQEMFDPKEERNIATLEHIRRMVNRVSGMEVLRYSRNHCIIKEISKGSAEEFENITNRLFLLMIDMGKDLIEAKKNKDTELCRMIHEYSEKNMNRLTEYSLRILNKIGCGDSTKTVFVYQMITSIEAIADCYADMARKTTEADGKVLHLLEQTILLLASVYKAFLKKDMADVSKAYSIKEDIKKECLMIFKANDADMNLYVNLMHSLSDHAMNIVYSINALD